MRREEKKSASANGTIRQEVLAELEKTRNLFELNDLQPVHGYSWTTVGKMRDADKVC
jgi:hypothetical protein